MLPDYFYGLNSVRDAELARFVHVHSLRNAFLSFFHDPVFEHERRDASFLKPARDVIAFQIDGKRYKSAARRDDNSCSGSLRFFREIGGQRRSYHIEDDRADRSVIRGSFLLGPALGAGRNAWPNIHDL